MRIILLDHEPFTLKRRSFFYINELIQNRLKVEVWNMSDCTIPQYSTIPDQLYEPYIYSISSFEAFRNRIESLDEDLIIFICEIAFDWKNRKFWKLLNKRNFIKVKIDPFGNNISKYEISLSLKEKIERNIPLIGSILFSKIKSALFDIYIKIRSIEGVKYIFSSSWYYSDKININHPDFEDFKYQNSSDVVGIDYILFIDNYVPYHPDIVITMGNNIPSAIDYHNTMKCYFDFLENKYKIPIIIAAHPKSLYTGDEFGINRRIIKYQTNLLVANASKIIIHSSNSISFISLYNKPLQMIMTNEIEKISIIKNKMKWISMELDIPIFNISKENFENLYFKQIPSKKREDYMYSYLTSKKTENMKNSDIIIDFILKLENRYLQ